jgi:hypothetical protein
LVAGIVDQFIERFAIRYGIMQTENFADPVTPKIGCFFHFMFSTVELKPLGSYFAVGREYNGYAGRFYG